MATQGYIYVGFDASGFFKIGITNDHNKRLKQFKTGNVTFQYLFVFVVEYPAVTELELHTKFDKSRIKGEWFDLSPQDLKWIYDKFMGDHARHTIEAFRCVTDIVHRGDAIQIMDVERYMSENGFSPLMWEEQ